MPSIGLQMINIAYPMQHASITSHHESTSDMHIAQSLPEHRRKISVFGAMLSRAILIYKFNVCWVRASSPSITNDHIDCAAARRCAAEQPTYQTRLGRLRRRRTILSKCRTHTQQTQSLCSPCARLSTTKTIARHQSIRTSDALNSKPIVQIVSASLRQLMYLCTIFETFMP